MKELITDEMLAAFAVLAPLDEVSVRVHERYGDVADRFSFYVPYPVEGVQWREELKGFRQG